MRFSLVCLLAVPAIAAAQPTPTSYAPDSGPAHEGYWASAGLDFLAARAAHPYVRVEGGLPITRSLSLQVPVFVAEGRRDFFDWDRPDYDWMAAAIVPGLLVEKVVHRWDGHYLTLGGDAGLGVHVLRSNPGTTDDNISIAGLARATVLVRVVTNTGLLVHIAPLGLGVMAASDQTHFWYEGSILVGFRWP